MEPRSSSRPSSRATSRAATSTNPPLQPPQSLQQSSMTSNSSRIKVVARFRPYGGSSCIRQLTDSTAEIDGLATAFVFDRVFFPESTQQQVFEDAVLPTVEAVLDGYNGCVLAYGQTGSGKSHTMMGPAGVLDDENRGAIPRMVDYLFAKKPDDNTVKVAYMEIYNERVRDLLGSGADLKVHELAAGGGFYVKGLTEVSVSSAEDVYTVMRRGSRNRSVAATNMNAVSSRSHSVFSVEVLGPRTRSKLVLVDLAGSEKVAKTGARGALLEEAANINRSLTSLGMVVNALASDSLQHIPFRDSKLTRILQDSLSGNSRTTLIVHASPSASHASETISSLRFGIRAKHIQIAPRVNLVSTDESSEALDAHRELYDALRSENERLLALHAREAAREQRQREEISQMQELVASAEEEAELTQTYLLSEVWSLRPRLDRIRAFFCDRAIP